MKALLFFLLFISSCLCAQVDVIEITNSDDVPQKIKGVDSVEIINMRFWSDELKVQPFSLNGEIRCQFMRIEGANLDMDLLNLNGKIADSISFRNITWNKQITLKGIDVDYLDLFIEHFKRHKFQVSVQANVSVKSLFIRISNVSYKNIQELIKIKGLEKIEMFEYNITKRIRKLCKEANVELGIIDFSK